MGLRTTIFGQKYGITIGVPNTFIGGVASVLGTKELIAQKFTNMNGVVLSASDIYNFTVSANDISFFIGIDFQVIQNAFHNGNPFWGYGALLTHFKHTENYFKTINNGGFANQTNLTDLDIKSVIYIKYQGLFQTGAKEYYLPNCLETEKEAFAYCSNMETLYLPICEKHGSTHEFENTFLGIKEDFTLYAKPSMATINNGAEEGDILAVRNTKKGIISYVQNYNAPNNFSVLNIGAIYGSAITLKSSSGSANAIYYYEKIKVNGIDYPNVKGDFYIYGLVNSITYNISAVAVDIYYNKSQISNVNVTTDSVYSFNTANFVSHYKMDETSGTILNDTINNENLIINNLTLGEPGKVGKSAKSTVQSSGASTTSATAINGNFTIVCSAKRTANGTASNCGMVEQGGFQENKGFGLWTNANGQLGWRINRNYSNYIPTVLPLNTWVNVALVYDGATAKIYYNGALISTKAVTTNPAPSTNRRLFFREFNQETYIGQLDEVGLFNSALPQIDLIEISGKVNAGQTLI